MTETYDQSADIRHLLSLYLTDKDIRYKRLLDSLTTEQLRHACGAFCQSMAFGSVREGETITEESGGYAASCVRMAILAGYAEGLGYPMASD